MSKEGMRTAGLEEAIAAYAPRYTRIVQRPKRDAAAAWLKAFLKDGPVEANTVAKRAADAGITVWSLRLASWDLEVRKAPLPGFFQGTWFWSLKPENGR
jgi:hypothetical protein